MFWSRYRGGRGYACAESKHQTTLKKPHPENDADQDYLISCRDGFAPWNNSYTISSDGTVAADTVETK
eukprot:1798719-Amphidinium_carterae.1